MYEIHEALILGLLCCILGDAFESGDADGAIGSYDLRVQNRRTQATQEGLIKAALLAAVGVTVAAL